MYCRGWGGPDNSSPYDFANFASARARDRSSHQAARTFAEVSFSTCCKSWCMRSACGRRTPHRRLPINLQKQSARNSCRERHTNHCFSLTSHFVRSCSSATTCRICIRRFSASSASASDVASSSVVCWTASSVVGGLADSTTAGGAAAASAGAAATGVAAGTSPLLAAFLSVDVTPATKSRACCIMRSTSSGSDTTTAAAQTARSTLRRQRFARQRVVLMNPRTRGRWQKPCRAYRVRTRTRAGDSDAEPGHR